MRTAPVFAFALTGNVAALSRAAAFLVLVLRGIHRLSAVPLQQAGDEAFP